MKNIIKVTLVTVIILALNVLLTAGTKPPAPATVSNPVSWFGTYGMMGYPGLTSGYVYAAELNYPLSQVGFYTKSGQAFVGQAPVLTHISGSCFISDDGVARDFSATLAVDGVYTIPIFDVQGSVAVFDVTALGQSFVIRINVNTPLGCNILLESK